MMIKGTFLLLFLIGINSFTLAQVGKVGINTTTPAAMLHVLDSSVVFTGTNPLPVSPGAPPVSGTGTRMMWYPDKAAFRAGTAGGTGWNKDSIGLYSVAFGQSTRAKGQWSSAFGFGAYASGTASLASGNFPVASGQYSLALGVVTVASGSQSVAMGTQTKASGLCSMAVGETTEASGKYSVALCSATKAIGESSLAFGSFTIARPYAALSIGQYNDTTSLSSTSWNLNDPVFIIGNGTGNNARKNAMTVLKNGKTGINTNIPVAMLHVKDSSVLFTGTYPPPGIPGAPPVTGAGTRMMWYPDKGAFRVGSVSSTHWNKDSIGIYSMAFGRNTKASGDGSTAMGDGTIASGAYSTATGYNTIASGNYSTAIGNGTMANGFVSLATGYQTKTTVGSNYSTAMGNATTASGNNSMALGFSTKSIGTSSVSIGNLTTARPFASLVLGQYNDTTAISGNLWNINDPVFIIGNGTANNSRKNAVTILKNGRTGINTAGPLAMLHVKDSSVVFTGLNSLPGSPGAPPISGPGTRMMWYPDKAAFRAGQITATQWNKDSIGLYSVAFGQNTKAKGIYSSAFGNGSTASGSISITMGYLTKASGDAATAMGDGSFASGHFSTAMGLFTSATGHASTSMGQETVANGDASLSLGHFTNAKTYASVALGRFNDTTAYTPDAWNTLDPVFIIGIGTSNAARTNAMTVLKNGNVSIGPDVSPTNRLLISNNDSGDGGWIEGIMVESTNANTGEAAVAIKNTAIPATKQWIVGLNQSPTLAFNYGTNFAGGNNKMVIDTFGNVGIATTSPSAKLEVNGTTIIGTNGTTLSEIIKMTIGKDVTSVAANSALNVDFLVTNCALNSTVYVSPESDLATGLVIAYSRVSVAGTVRVKFTNTTAAAIDPPNMDYYITVIR